MIIMVKAAMALIIAAARKLAAASGCSVGCDGQGQRAEQQSTNQHHRALAL
jgi:hypothetical protein